MHPKPNPPCVQYGGWRTKSSKVKEPHSGATTEAYQLQNIWPLPDFLSLGRVSVKGVGKQKEKWRVYLYCSGSRCPQSFTL